MTSLRARIAILSAFLALAATTKLIDDFVQQNIERSLNDSISGLALLATLSVVWTLASSALGLLVTAKFLNLKADLSFRDFELICIETLRSIAEASIRLPLLILPAVFEWLRLAPVPFVVLFDPSYRRGEADALVTARAFFKKFPYRVLLLTGLTVLVSLGLTLLDSEQHIVSIFTMALGQFAMNWILLKIYLRSFTQLTEAHNSMSNKA